jgi:hypothetical protein
VAKEALDGLLSAASRGPPRAGHEGGSPIQRLGESRQRQLYGAWIRWRSRMGLAYSVPTGDEVSHSGDWHGQSTVDH